jgi:hypothetical protein
MISSNKISANYSSSRLALKLAYEGVTFIEFRSRTTNNETDEAGIYIKRSSSGALDKIIGARRTGWATPLGTAYRTALPASPTVTQIGSWCRALYDDLVAHGIIGA